MSFNRNQWFTVEYSDKLPEETALLEPLVSKFGVGLDHEIPIKQFVALTRVLRSNGLAKFMLRENDRSFEIVIGQNEGRKIWSGFVSKDSGQQVMTVQDVAEFLQVDREAVRRLCGGRQGSRLPFVKVSEKMIRFNRPDIEKWPSNKTQCDGPTATPLFSEIL